MSWEINCSIKQEYTKLIYFDSHKKNAYFPHVDKKLNLYITLEDKTFFKIYLFIKGKILKKIKLVDYYLREF